MVLASSIPASVGGIPTPVWFIGLAGAFVIAIALAVLLIVASLSYGWDVNRRIGKKNEQLNILKAENAKLATALLEMQEQSHPEQEAALPPAGSANTVKPARVTPQRNRPAKKEV